MNPVYVSAELRRQVRADAGHRCGYCRASERLTGTPLEIEHLVPKAAGGPTVRENLWLACHRCNKYKGMHTQGIDPLTSDPVPLYNPRARHWREHFAWSLDGVTIIGLTPCGRATVETLHLNNDYIVEARRFWVIAGWHPPVDE